MTIDQIISFMDWTDAIFSDDSVVVNPRKSFAFRIEQLFCRLTIEKTISFSCSDGCARFKACGVSAFVYFAEL